MKPLINLIKDARRSYSMPVTLAFAAAALFVAFEAVRGLAIVALATGTL